MRGEEERVAGLRRENWMCGLIYIRKCFGLALIANDSMCYWYYCQPIGGRVSAAGDDGRLILTMSPPEREIYIVNKVGNWNTHDKGLFAVLGRQTREEAQRTGRGRCLMEPYAVTLRHNLMTPTREQVNPIRIANVTQQEGGRRASLPESSDTGRS